LEAVSDPNSFNKLIHRLGNMFLPHPGRTLTGNGEIGSGVIQIT
jgi:hypothetical protein